MTVPYTHVTDDAIAGFRAARLDPDAIVAFTDHLAVCEECRRRTAAIHPSLDAMAELERALGLDDDAHVPELELHAFVDGTIDRGRLAAIEAHLTTCALCDGEVADLRAFMARTPDRSWRRGWYPWLAAAALLVFGVLYGVPGRSRRPDGVVATFVDSGSTITLDGEGRVGGAGPVGPDLQSLIRESVVDGRLPIPTTVLALSAPVGSLRGVTGPEVFRLSTPVGTAVRDGRPTFRWTPVANARGYVVTVQDEQSGSTVSSPVVLETAWRPDSPLATGSTFTWQVAARMDQGGERLAPAPPAPPARFTVLSSADAAALETLPASHLIRGVAYARAGLLDEAEREFEILAATNRGSETAAQLLSLVRDVRRTAPAPR